MSHDHSTLPETTDAHCADDLSRCLPGFKLTHTLHVVAEASASVVSRAAAVLEHEAVVADHWAVTRSGDVLTQKIVLADVTEQRAVRLRRQLAAVDGVLRTRIEHYFVRDATSGATPGRAV